MSWGDNVSLGCFHRLQCSRPVQSSSAEKQTQTESKHIHFIVSVLWWPCMWIHSSSLFELALVARSPPNSNPVVQLKSRNSQCFCCDLCRKEANCDTDKLVIGCGGSSCVLLSHAAGGFIHQCPSIAYSEQSTLMSAVLTRNGQNTEYCLASWESSQKWVTGGCYGFLYYSGARSIWCCFQVGASHLFHQLEVGWHFKECGQNRTNIVMPCSSGGGLEASRAR